MAWIESHQTLKEHPKMYKLVQSLNVSRSAAIGHLHLLWWWAIDYATDGELHVDENQIARAAEWPGDPKTFFAGLVESGFINAEENGIFLHDWLDYCGQLVEKRLKRMKDKRRKVADVRRKRDAVRAPTQPNPTQPNRTQPNPTQPYPTQPIKKSLSGASPDPRVKEFIDWFFTQFKTRTGETYHVNGGRDGQTVKRLLGTFDLETLRERGLRFFQSNDSFIVKAGYSIGIFASQINKLVPTSDPGTERMRKMAEAAQRHVEAGGKLP